MPVFLDSFVKRKRRPFCLVVVMKKSMWVSWTMLASVFTTKCVSHVASFIFKALWGHTFLFYVWIHKKRRSKKKESISLSLKRSRDVVAPLLSFFRRCMEECNAIETHSNMKEEMMMNPTEIKSSITSESGIKRLEFVMRMHKTWERETDAASSTTVSDIMSQFVGNLLYFLGGYQSEMI